jgi:mannosyltransferase OCH1-like enzyme
VEFAMNSIIFSKDRALQLDATLKSFERNCRDFSSAKIDVLYTVSSELHEGQYVELANMFPKVSFVRERVFYHDCLNILKQAQKHILFLVDDNLFIAPFRLDDISRCLDLNPDALGFSLRLGKNTTYCYPQDRIQPLPFFLPVSKNVLAFHWPTASFDFSYPFDLSSSVYRVDDILRLMRRLSFTGPNQLECQMFMSRSSFAISHPSILCFEKSIAFCLPVNMVQNEFNNRITDIVYSAEQLAQKFSDGVRVATEKYEGLVPVSCHQDLPLEFEGRESLSDPKVTIIMPCYNYGKYLGESVDSLLMQTFTDFEIVIVNDGSSDDTLVIAVKIKAANTQRRIRIINQVNSGCPAVPRNRGIAAARGDYILPLDPDDKISPDFLSKTVAVLDTKPEIGVAYSHIKHFCGRQDIWESGLFDIRVLARENVVPYCALYRKSVWEMVGGYRTDVGYEDWHFWLDCCQNGVVGELIPEPLFFYRKHDGGRLVQDNSRRERLLAEIIVKHPTLYTTAEYAKAEAILSREINSNSGSQLAERTIATSSHMAVHSVIPKKLHIIWVGDESRRPDNCIRTWTERNPSWSVKVWGNAELEKVAWWNARHMCEMAARELNGVADMMRWEILYREGGFSVDADSSCVRPLDDWLLEHEAFACWENEIVRPQLIAAGYVAAKPGNPFIGQIIRDINAEKSVINNLAWMTVGPQRLTDSYRRYKYTDMSILPSHYFIPEHFSGLAYKGQGPVYAKQYWGSTRKSYDSLHRETIP